MGSFCLQIDEKRALLVTEVFVGTKIFYFLFFGGGIYLREGDLCVGYFFIFFYERVT